MLFSPQIAARSKRYSASGSGGGGGGAPPPISGMIGWYDASVTSSLTLSSSTITNIADQSGAGNHLGDGTTSSRPTYSATGLNSLPAMVFSAASSQRILATSGAFPMGTGNTLTCFLVATMSSSSDAFARALSYGTGGAHDYNNAGSWLCGRNSNSQQALLLRNSNQLNPAIAAYDTPYRCICTIDASGAMTVYINGSATTGVTSAGNWVNNGLFALGGGVYDLGACWTGSIAEVGVSTVFTNSTDVATLDTALQTKWGL